MNDEQLKMIYEPFLTKSRSQGCSGSGMHVLNHCVFDPLKGSVECLVRPRYGRDLRVRYVGKAD